MTASTRAHIELWGERGLSLTEGKVDCRDPEGFWMRGAHWSFGDVLLSDLSFSPISVSPVDAESRLKREAEYLIVSFLLSGSFSVHTPERDTGFAPGDGAYIAGWWSVSGENPVPARVLTLSVPRAELVSYGIEAPDRFTAFRPPTLVHDPLLPFLRMLLPVIDHNSIPAEPIATVIVRLTAGLFISEEAQLETADPAARRLRAQADEIICRWFGNSALSPAMLATTLGVTPAELDRLFDETGSAETVGATIEMCRVTHAVEYLGTPTADPSPSILDAATRSGFSGIAALDRAVQSVYGVSTISMLAGLRRLNEADYPDEGGVQKFVSRLPRSVARLA